MQDEINDFYLKTRQINTDDSMKDKPYSGLSLVNKILPNESVIDIGCGNNIFKKLIPNLIGIDPVFDSADFKTDLQNFTTDQKFDVAFCLGSMHYGDEQDIEHQITRVTNLLKTKARIYWRFNIDPSSYGLKFTKYIWSVEKNHMFAEKFGFEVAEWQYEFVNENKKLYAEWVR